MSDRLEELSTIGVSIWLDDLDRSRLTSGGLAAAAADLQALLNETAAYRRFFARAEPASILPGVKAHGR